MPSLPHPLLDRIVVDLTPVAGVRALALAGSYPRGTARGGSDVDIALFYDEAAPLDVEAVRDVSAGLHDTARLGPPVVTTPYEWGPWVNGGAWLTVNGQHVDLPRRPPCVSAAHDPAGVLAALRGRVTSYPTALREAIVRGQLWSAEPTGVHAVTYAERGDVVHTAGCLTRMARALVHVLFAWNEVFFTSDKTVLAEIGRFAAQPEDFAARLTLALAQPGSTPAELARTVAAVRALTAETAALCAQVYRSKYPSILA